MPSIRKLLLGVTISLSLSVSVSAGQLTYEFGPGATPNFKAWFTNRVWDLLYLPLTREMVETPNTPDQHVVIDFQIIEPQPNIDPVVHGDGFVTLRHVGDLPNSIFFPDSVIATLMIQALATQGWNGLHSDIHWFEARATAIAAVMSDRAAAGRVGTFPIAIFTMGIDDFELIDTMGTNVLGGTPWPFDQGVDQQHGQTNIAIDRVYTAMWWIVSNAYSKVHDPGSFEFFGKLNELWLERGESTEQAALEVLDSMDFTIDGQLPSKWVKSINLTRQPEDGLFLGSAVFADYPYENFDIRRLITLIDRRDGATTLPDLEDSLESYIVEIRDVDDNLVPLPDEPYPDFGLLPTEDLYRLKIMSRVDGNFLIGTSLAVRPGDFDGNIQYLATDPKVSIVTDGDVVEEHRGRWIIQAEQQVQINDRTYTLPHQPIVGAPTYKRSVTDQHQVCYIGVQGLLGLDFQGIAVTNSSHNQAGWVNLDLFSQDGNLLSSSGQIALKTHLQRPKLLHEWFDNLSEISQGYVRLTTSSQEVKAFTLYGNLDEGFLDGTNALCNWSKDYVLPPNAQSISIINPGSSTTQVETSLIDPSGTPQVQTQAVDQIESGEVKLVTMAPSQYGHLRVTSDDPILVSAKLSADPTGSEIQLVNGFDANQAINKTTYFSHVVLNFGWVTRIDLTNVGKAGTVRLVLVDENGINISSAELFLGTDQSMNFDVKSFFGLSTEDLINASLRIIPGSGVQLAGFASLSEDGGMQSILPLPKEARRDFTLNQLATTSGFATGVSVLNPNPVDVLVDVEVYQHGHLLGKTQVTIGPGQKLVRFIDELVPEAAGQSEGYIHIKALKPLYVVALFEDFEEHIMASLEGLPQ